MTETEKEMQTIREAATEKDLQKLDSLTHHLRSSWEVLRADQPLNVLYRLLHGDVLPDGEALSHAVYAVRLEGTQYTILSSTTIIVVLSIFVFSPFLFCQPDYFRSLIQHGSHGMA